MACAFLSKSDRVVEIGAQLGSRLRRTVLTQPGIAERRHQSFQEGALADRVIDADVGLVAVGQRTARLVVDPGMTGRMDGVAQANNAVVAQADLVIKLGEVGLGVLSLAILTLGFFGIKSIRDVRKFRDQAAASQKAAAKSRKAAAKCASNAQDCLSRTEEAARSTEELRKSVESAWEQVKERVHALQDVNLKELSPEVKRELEELKTKTDLLEMFGMPLDAAGYLARGNAYFVHEDYERALKCYDRAIELKPNYAEAHYNRGLALARLARIIHTDR